jgi:hypothetical protein
MEKMMHRHRTKIIAGAAILAVLAVAFFWGGNYAKGGAESSAQSPIADVATEVTLPSAEPAAESTAAQSGQPGEQPDANAQAAKDAPSKTPDGESSPPNVGMAADPKPGKDKSQTDPVPEGSPVPVEPQDSVVTDEQLTCTLSVRCDTILDNMELLDKDKWELVPGDGVIFATASVVFYEGESVFNVLQREMKQARIQMEFSNVPMYNSAYIEGLNNLYEFDAGELSGWMYKVNDWFPNYGSSRYQLEQGDVIEWLYTCDLGKDIGGANLWGGRV